MTDKILSEKRGPVGALIFNNPERRNAVSLEMWEAVEATLSDFAKDPAVRVVVLSGAGGKAFVSGADISEFEKQRSTPETVASYNRTSARAHEVLQQLDKPTVAMIRGWCMGGGVALALACDLRVCSDDSKFGIPAARLGLGYRMPGIRRLAEVVGPSAAKEILFTARHYTADEALRLGLVNRVVAGAELEPWVEAYAAQMAENAPLTIAAVKRIVAEIVKDPADRDLEICERLVEQCFASQDYVEGRRAFMEKRRPSFTGR